MLCNRSVVVSRCGLPFLAFLLRNPHGTQPRSLPCAAGLFLWPRAVQPVVLCLWVCRLTGKPVHVCRLSPARTRGYSLVPAVKEFAFEVVLIARVRVRATDEASARQAVPSVIGAPGSAEIALANQGIDVLLPGTMVTAVDFIPNGKVKPVRR